MLQKLIDEYRQWNKANGLALGSADEHLHDEALTQAQRECLADFCARWEVAQSDESVLYKLVEDDGAVLYWQLPARDAVAFESACLRGVIRFDPSSDLYIHPQARDLGDGSGYTMAAA